MGVLGGAMGALGSAVGVLGRHPSGSPCRVLTPLGHTLSECDPGDSGYEYPGLGLSPGLNFFLSVCGLLGLGLVGWA